MGTSIRMKSSLTAIRSLQAAIAGMTAEEYFIDGLRTGFRLALAILDEEENGLLKPISDGGKQP